MVPVLPAIPLNSMAGQRHTFLLKSSCGLFWCVMSKSCLAWLRSRFRCRPYQLKKCLSAFRFHSTRHQHFFPGSFLNEDTYADDSRTITELMNAIFIKLGHLTSQIVDKAITDLGTVRLLAVTLRKRAETGSFTLKCCWSQIKGWSGRWHSEPVLSFHW